MKLNTIVSSLALLGLVTSGIAAPSVPSSATAGNKGGVIGHGSAQTNVSSQAESTSYWLNQDPYWMGIINRNQDNAYLVTQAAGQTKVSGLIATDFGYAQRPLGFGNTESNGLANSSSANLAIAEIYFDSQINSWFSGHVALAYGSDDADNGIGTGPNTGTTTSQPQMSSTFGNSQMYLTEAYGMFTYNNFYAKVGRQYANFSTTTHNSISVTPTQALANLNAVGATLGAVTRQGIYGDVFVYQGSPYGSYTNNGTPAQNDYTNVNANAHKIHGYVVNLGYALNQGANDFYGVTGGNFYVDYIGNMADTSAMKWTLENDDNNYMLINTKQIGGIAAHADYSVGAFQVLLDYVTALARFDRLAYSGNAGYFDNGKGEGAKPAAYSVQASYSWNATSPQKFTLAYGGTQDAANVYSFGSGSTMAEHTISATYAYFPLQHVKLAVQYANAKDYDSSYTGGHTGKTDNIVTLRAQIAL